MNFRTRTVLTGGFLFQKWLKPALEEREEKGKGSQKHQTEKEGEEEITSTRERISREGVCVVGWGLGSILVV